MERNLDGSLAYCDIHVKEIKDVSALSDKVEKWTDRLSQANGIGKRISYLDGPTTLWKKTPHGASLSFK